MIDQVRTWLVELPLLWKIVLILGFLFLFMTLSPVLSVLAIIALIVGFIALLVQAIRGRNLRTWGIFTGAAFITAVLGGVFSSAIYDDEAAQTEEAEPDPPVEETTQIVEQTRIVEVTEAVVRPELTIDEAEWEGDVARVRGTWTGERSALAACDMLEGADRGSTDWWDRDASPIFSGEEFEVTFRQVNNREPEDALDPATPYFVRCVGITESENEDVERRIVGEPPVEEENVALEPQPDPEPENVAPVPGIDEPPVSEPAPIPEPALEVAPAPEAAPVPSGADGGYNCSDFSSPEQAQAYMQPGDPDGLDADGDGLACEVE